MHYHRHNMINHPSTNLPQSRKLYRCLHHTVVTTAVPVIAGIVNVPAAAAVLETVPVIVGLVNVPVVSVVLETATVPVITGLVVIPTVVLETTTVR